MGCSAASTLRTAASILAVAAAILAARSSEGRETAADAEASCGAEAEAACGAEAETSEACGGIGGAAAAEATVGAEAETTEAFGADDLVIGWSALGTRRRGIGVAGVP